MAPIARHSIRMKLFRRISPLVGAAVISIGSLIGCSERGAGERSGGDTTSDAYGGTFVISIAADVDYLFPPLVATSAARGITELIFDHLAEVGDSLNVIGDGGFEPRLAERWEWGADSLSLTFYLNPKARWHDGEPVRASDVVFTHRLYTDPALVSLAASILGNIDSVSAKDSLTTVFWFKRRSPSAFFDAAGQMLILPEHVYGSIPPSQLATSELIRKPVGSGRFRFVRWTPGSTIELASDIENYRGRAKLDRVIWTISPDFNAAMTKLLAGSADFFETMTPESMGEIARNPSLRALMYPGFDYGFLMFNLRNRKSQSQPHPIFADKGVRRALTMAVDRVSIVRNILDSLAYVSLGPMLRAMPLTDTTITQIPYDTVWANRLLDSLGWKMNNKGVREKQGRTLSFTLITPSSSKSRSRAAVLLQEQLKRVGVDVKIQQLESIAFTHRQQSRDFDAAMHTWHLDAAPGNIVQTWGTVAAVPGGTNYGGYSNPIFDAQVDSALAASSLEQARPLFKRAYQTIVDDAPAIWLYEIKGASGIHKRIRVTAIRPDAWWAHIADWYIPANERIERDRIPPAAQ
jgi:peptide/nickel transport system substrate-binding protein